MTWRFLLAVAFVVFCASAVAAWGVKAGPWWVPFATSIGIPFVLGGAILIMEGPSGFTNKD